MFIVDAHLDLAYNAIDHGRDLQQPIKQLRQLEGKRPPGGIATVTIPEIKRAGIGIVFGTLFAMPANSKLASLSGENTYQTADQAFSLGVAQLDYYHRLADEDESIRLIGNQTDLSEVLKSEQMPDGRLLGIVPLMEGADPIREPQELERWVERGLRIIGLAWDDTRYASGSWRNSRHGLTKDGMALLEAMAEFGLILDITHMSEKASLEALERYEGTAVATHSNCQALVPGERQLSNDQIQIIGQKGGVIGMVLYNPFLKAGHRIGEPKNKISLDNVVAHIDHICQLLGDAAHVGIGSDFDGGFGAADIPQEMDTIFDLNLIPVKLREKGYSESDISAVMGRNWINILQQNLKDD